jgi:hypothetical protein
VNRASAAFLQILNNQQRQYKTVYIAIFEGIATRFSTGPITSPQGDTLGFMMTPAGVAAQITPDQGKSSLGNTVIDLVDVDERVTALLRTYQMANRKITLKQGFIGLPESSFLTVAVGLVQGYQLVQQNMVWRFTTTTLLTQEQNNIFSAFATLVRDVGIADTTIYVDSTQFFPTATNGCCYLLLGSEAISYTGTTPGSFTGCQRAQLATTAQTGATGDQPTNLVVMQGGPLTIALQILTSTGTGLNGPYDQLPACAGLAIPFDQVNIGSFITQQTQWLPSLQLRFEESASTVAQDFLEGQIYQFCNAYPLVEADGRIGVHVYGPVMPQSQVALITDDDMVGPPVWAGSVLDRYFFNEVDIEYDYNFRTGAFDRQAFFENTDSQQVFGRTVTWQGGAVQSRGFRGDVTGPYQINAWANRLLQRFSGATAPVTARVMFAQTMLTSGDIVPITSRFLPDLTTGTKGVVAHLYEVIEVLPEYKDGTMQLQLLDTGYTYGKQYCAISPSGYPVYTAATPAERNYGFICQKVAASIGVMSNGDPGYLITQ